MKISLNPKINDFFTNSYVITGVGVGTAQCISILTYPIIARLLGPAIFTEFSFLLSVLLILIVVSTFKIENSLFVVDYSMISSIERVFQYVLPITSIIILSFFIFLSFLNGLVTVVGAFSLVFTTFWVSQFEFYIQKNIRFKLYSLNAIMRIIRAVFFLLSVLCLSLLELLTADTAIVAYGFSNLLPSSKYLIRYYNSSNRGVIRLSEVWPSVKDTVLFLSLAHFIQKYSLGCFVILCSFLKGDSLAEVGLFALAFKLTIAPVQIVTASIADVLKRTLLDNPDNALAEYVKLLVPMTLFFILWVIGLYFFGEYIVAVFLGDEWLGLIDYCISLLPYLFALLYFSPLTYAFLIFKKQKWDFNWQLLNALSITMVIYGYQYLTVLELSFLFALVASVSLIIAGFISLYLIRNSSKRVLS